MKILVIQTAFIGDVILATPVIEKLHMVYPDAQLDFLLRKGNEGLFENHPFLRKVIVWDKKQNKLRNLFNIAKAVRKEKYDKVINLHRFASSGWIVFRSGAKERIGFDKNPFAFCYTKKVKHVIGGNRHEIDRNLELIGDSERVLPKLYPSKRDEDTVKEYKQPLYICIAPTSVWFTKQLPENKWIEFIKALDKKYKVYLVGSSADSKLCERICAATGDQVRNLAGKLGFLQTAALMRDAPMNFVNDSAPMHIASSVNAPVTAVYCSTVPGFGFGPLSQHSFIVETKEKLDCKPCGLHGYKACPLGHFRCATTIQVGQLMKSLEK